MTNRFEKKETYSISEVLSKVPPLSSLDKKERRKYRLPFDGDFIKMCSDRYYTFLKSTQCCFCGIQGQFFRKERHINKKGEPLTESFHFNLYAIDSDGQEVLMTKDHIHPKARGGRNSLSNYQTACATCNELKSASKNSTFVKKIKKQQALLMNY